MRLHIAMPAMDESSYLPSSMAALFSQSCSYPYHIYVCVNQPERYWQKRPELCLRNRESIAYLQSLHGPLSVIDRSSPGQGWSDKHSGVGWARKTLFEHICVQAERGDLILSLDADTLVDSNYCQTVGDYFASHSKTQALSLPYYHPLGDDDRLNRAILRYETYMRLYYLNLQAIASPYAFTALGSAMAFRVEALQRIGGIKPLPSGEDFYLLQKFCKTGRLGQNCACRVMPATRLSDRVDFGTGPALGKGCQGNWESYPFYRPELFAPIAEAYGLIPEIYQGKGLPDNAFLSFLEQQFKSQDLWQPLRDNLKDLPHFCRGFHEKADGLRILQYLKYRQQQEPYSEKACLQANLRLHLDMDFPYESIEQAPLAFLASLRDRLFEQERMAREIQG